MELDFDLVTISEKKNMMRCTFLHHGALIHQNSQQVIQQSCVPDFPILSDLNLSSCGLVDFINMNTYILTKGRSFKTFLEENYAIALENCYFFTKNVEHGIKHDVDNAYYGVCIH